MKIKVLKEDVEHHVKDEEGEMFPDARKFLGENRLMAWARELGSAQATAQEKSRCQAGTGNQTRALLGRPSNYQREVMEMRYGIAWLLGVPVSVLVIWYVVSHLL